MRRTAPIRRWATRGSLAAVTALTLATGMQAAVTGAQAAVTSPAVHHPPAVTNPYSPAYHHSYRVGVVPTIPRLAKMRQWARSHPGAVAAASANDLNYGGGIDGIGVTTGAEKVDLVFFGSQWAPQGTHRCGYVPLSGASKGDAPSLQA